MSFRTFRFGASTTDTGSGHDHSSNLQVLCSWQVKMGMPKATSYFSLWQPIRFPTQPAEANLPCPTGSSTPRWSPQFLRSACPQMGAATAPLQGLCPLVTQMRLTGSALLLSLHSCNPAPVNGGRFPRCSLEIAYAACCPCGRMISVRSLFAS